MLYDVDASCVRNAFLNLLVNKGFQVKTVNDTQIVVGRGARNFGALLLLGTRGGGNPEDRMTGRFLAMQINGVRVVISGAYVSNPGTGFEKLTQIPPNANDQQQMQQMGSNLSQTCHKVG